MRWPCGHDKTGLEDARGCSYCWQIAQQKQLDADMREFMSNIPAEMTIATADGHVRRFRTPKQRGRRKRPL